MLNPCVYILPKNPKFDYAVGQTSNGYNSLNINPNHANFVFKVKLKMSTFQWNKLHPNIIYGSKVMFKTLSKYHSLTSFSKQFDHFWVMITSKLLK